MAIGMQSERFRSAAEKLTADWAEKPILFTCDVAEDESIERAGAEVSAAAGGKVHALCHSIAFATAHGMKAPFLECTREDFRVAHDISAYTVVAVTRAFLPALEAADGASVLALSYIGSQRVVPAYSVMGPAKASLEATVRYLAAECGPKKITVNTISAGPIQTAAARGIRGFTVRARARGRRVWVARSGAPGKSAWGFLVLEASLRCFGRSQELKTASDAANFTGRPIEAGDVGSFAAFLASDGARNITGQTLYGACGVGKEEWVVGWRGRVGRVTRARWRFSVLAVDGGISALGIAPYSTSQAPPA